MSSTVQDFTSWMAGSSLKAENNTLAALFKKQNTGKRLKESDFGTLETIFTRMAGGGPTTIALHLRNEADTVKGRSFVSDLYYLIPPDSLIDLEKDPKGRGINPHNCPLWVTNTHATITPKTRIMTSRTLPIMFHNEKVETDYLRETARTIEYRCPDMEFSIGFGLLLSQIYEKNKVSQGHPYPYGIPALVPYRDGYLTGEIIDHDLEIDSKSMDIPYDTRRQVLGFGKVIETDRDSSVSLHLSGFRLYNSDLDSLIRSEFPTSSALETTFRHFLDDYAAGHDMPWPGNPRRDVYLELQDRIQRVIGDSLWTRSTHTGLFKHSGLVRHNTIS
jgi:hypothetical protein